MQKSKFIVNVFSNWTMFGSVAIVAFIVSPMMVHNLGTATYGVWVLIISMTSYFSVLDFGFNTAIVKYISQYAALKNYKKASEVYTAAFILFFVIAVCLVLFASVFAMFITDFIEIGNFSRNYIYIVFLTVSMDLALKLVFGTNSATLRGMHNYFEINVVGITVLFIRTIIIIYLLQHGYSLLSLALLQISMGILAISAHAYLVRTRYSFLQFKPNLINKSTYSVLLQYTVYSFMISISLKALEATDSIIIGTMLKIDLVTYYAIPQMILEHLQRLIWAAIAVLIPIVSMSNINGDLESSRRLYVIGTKYSLIMCSPILLVLFTAGDDFIGLWMGTEFESKSGRVLTILLTGYIFSLSQMIAHAILKGIAKHKVYAYILCLQAAINVILSIYLAPIYGIEGVAIGTAIPLLLVSIFLIPYFTCKELSLNLRNYWLKSYLHPLLAFLIPLMLIQFLHIKIHTYSELILFSAITAFAYAVYAFFFHLEPDHRKWVLQLMRITK